VHGPRRPGRLLGHDLCAQLGRIYQGHFGWIDARHRFRPVGFQYEEAPIQCGERWRDARSSPVLTRTTLITDPLQTEAQPTETVIWGIAGSLLRGVALQGPRIHDLHPKPSRRGAFLALADPTGPSKVTAHFRYAQRRPKTLALNPTRFGPVPPPFNRFQHGMILGTERLEARAPDPTGGLAWGIEASRTTKGGFCAWDVGRVVGSQVGNVNYALGTIDDPHAQPCLQKIQFPPKMPLSISEQYGAGASFPGESGADPDLGRVALRTLPGRSVISGLARPTVREFTIETPRDVRTIIPSPRAHAFIIVYDGSFPAGNTVIRVTFNDGTHRVQRMPNYPF
ncbi:MAG TPA: hypothetical protein VH817_24450, partial [Thermoleophilaceae bacterium]